jgi:hypothetical protein
VPSSTFTLPLTLCKWVKASQLGSIAKTGLNFQFSYVVFNGMSAGTPYLSRDLFLKGVWLATGDDTGAQFMVDKEAYIMLEVDVNRLFRDCYCRESNAVLWDKDVSYKKDAEKEGTVVCFADIPPQFIFCTVPEDIALAITEKFNSSKLKPGRQKLPALGRDLNDVIKALTEKAQKEAK